MRESALFLILVLTKVHSVLCTDDDVKSAILKEEKALTFCGLADKLGYPCVRHNVTTKDGYILGIFNIPGNKSKPIYLQHGFADSSFTFLVRLKSSWVAYLADQGYDLWLGNMRGNVHSRDHVTLDPNRRPYWEFSFHEIAKYDASATIDFILNKTGQAQLQVIAHSEGTTLFYVLCSLMPEYNQKLKVVICLAPIAYLHHAQSPLFPLLALLGRPISGFLPIVAHGEILNNGSVLNNALQFLCVQRFIGNRICNDALFSVLFGPDPEQLEDSFVRFVVKYYPAGTSLKNAAHLLQLVARRKFAQFDYGLANRGKYKQASPPEYDLSRVTCNLVLVVGRNDRLTAIKDVEILRRQLPKQADYHVVEYEKWNHVDFVWGKYLPNYLYEYVFGKLEEYY